MGARGFGLLRRRWTLRNRVAWGFALMALVLGGVLAAASWTLAASYLNRHQEHTAVALTADNALLIEAELRSGERPSTHLLDRIQYSPGSLAFLSYDGRHYPNATAREKKLASVLGVDLRSPTPSRLPTMTSPGRTTVNGSSFLVVSVPLRDGSGNTLTELYPLFDLDRTLRMLWMVVIAGAVIVGAAGLLVGKMASRRMLRPLADVTAAAGSIAHGDLSARLQVGEDPDLEPLARSFNRTAAALERRVHADARFAGDVSHELRTPLTTMINSIVLLQNRRAELPAEVVEPLDLLTEDLQRFRRLVVDLLDISRSDSGRADTREPVVVADLIRRAADAVAGTPVAEVAPGAEGVVLRADKRRLERVVSNLVENAAVHGGGCDAVRVSRRHGAVRLEVDDRGPGVAEGLRERIFDRFARDGSTQGPGVGLGLAIVAQHVHWHEGEVWVEDRPGGGARFVVELPVAGDVRASRAAPAARAETASGSGRSGARVRRWRWGSGVHVMRPE